MRECELCGLRARMHCEADQASLCWDCDEKVHGANFLVAKHPRSLLCHVCQSPTPWKGSGPKLTPTVSVCESCVRSHGDKLGQEEVRESEADNEDDDVDGDGGDDEEDGDGDGDGDGDEDEDEDENQVVPWSCCSYSVAQPPPPAVSCSSSEDEEQFSVSKRMRENNYNADVDSDDEVRSDGTAAFGSLRPLKRPRLVGEEDGEAEESRSTAIVSSIRRLQNEAINDRDHASATILGICKLSRDDK